MPTERYFLAAPFSEGQHFYLEGQEFHHLTHVMRGKAEDTIELVNGQGELASATIQTIEKKRSAIKVMAVQREAPPTFEIILAQAIPRLNRLDFILEKGTELGMTQLWLFPSDYSERKSLTEHQLERLQAITVAAMKQCGRLYLPKIHLHPPLEKWSKPPYLALFGDVSPSAPLFAQLWESQRVAKSAGILFFVGSESGFSEKEEKRLLTLGAQGVKLHSNILRTDTASLAALALIYHWLLDGER
jgi:16S rRNA (uracil1498-N3)-methyltransferase